MFSTCVQFLIISYQITFSLIANKTRRCLTKQTKLSSFSHKKKLELKISGNHPKRILLINSKMFEDKGMITMKGWIKGIESLPQRHIFES